MDLLSLKNEINQLKTIIVTAVELIKHALVSLQDTHKPMSTAMDTNADQSANSKNTTDPTQTTCTQLDLPALIKELKNDIATITQATRAFAHQHSTPKMNTNLPSSSVM